MERRITASGFLRPMSRLFLVGSRPSVGRPVKTKLRYKRACGLPTSRYREYRAKEWAWVAELLADRSHCRRAAAERTERAGKSRANPARPVLDWLDHWAM